MLYLIRHSTTARDPGKSSHSWVLSPDGRDRAQRLARQLSSQPAITRIYTSIEAKASETANIMAAELGIPCLSFDGLHEQQRHTAPYFSTADGFRSAIAGMFAHPDELVFGEETALQASSRISEAIHEIDRQHPSDNIAIVSHGTVLSLFIARHNPDIDIYEFWQELTMPDCYVVSRPGFGLQRRIPEDSPDAEGVPHEGCH